MSARWGKTNGMRLVVIACARVASSRIEAQFINRLLICSTVVPFRSVVVGGGRGVLVVGALRAYEKEGRRR